jgi:uncharacterized protein (DUF697 family)
MYMYAHAIGTESTTANPTCGDAESGSSTDPSSAVVNPTVDPALHKAANAIIHRNILWALGAGLVPNPLFDAVAVAVIELKMIDELATVYQFPFPTQLATAKALMSLVFSIGPISLASVSQNGLSGHALAGYGLSAGIFSLTGAIAVFAVGKVFQKHFESGGTLLSSDNRLFRKLVKEEASKAQEELPSILATQARSVRA